MSKTMKSLGFAAAIGLLATSAGAAPNVIAQTLPPGQECATFKETGKQVCGRFLQYWREHGGLAIQGFPISEQMNQVSQTDGKTYTMQYFERAVFELHPENKAPFDVLLSLLGTQFYKAKYPNGAPGQAANKSTGARTFPQTGANLGGAFLQYWDRTGGLMQHGYPISQEFTEKSDLNGKEYKVQYFERAVFEFHPENPRESQVLLSQLGTFQMRKQSGNTTTDPKPGAQPVATGQWGGRSLSVQVTSDESRFELDCAHGVIKGRLMSDTSGKFTHQGTYTFERGGPVREGEHEDTHPAVYMGTVSGNKMEVQITVNRPEGSVVIGPFIAVLGEQPLLFKCQ
jgi:hypothetical protein